MTDQKEAWVIFIPPAERRDSPFRGVVVVHRETEVVGMRTDHQSGLKTFKQLKQIHHQIKRDKHEYSRDALNNA